MRTARTSFRLRLASVIAAGACMAMAAPAWAQGTQPTTPWSLDVGIGWDTSISGDVLAGSIGTIENRPTVIVDRSWDDVYGTGVHFRIGAGYELDERSELRVNFRYQSTGANDVVEVGNIAGQTLFATFDDYKAWGLEGGYRRYFSEPAENWRPYAEGAIGFAVISDIDADLTVPASGILLSNTEFYDGSGAFTFNVSGGVLYQFTDRIAADGRVGLRYVSGLSVSDMLENGGLSDVDNDSSRWTLPITVGVRFRF